MARRLGPGVRRLALVAAALAAGWLGGLAGVARAQALPPLAEVAVDPPVDVLGDALHGLSLRKTVLLMRHGVRPPTSTAKFQVYASDPFPTWDVPDGYLTGHGASLVGQLGGFERRLYSALGLLSSQGCARLGDLFVWSDNADERTMATGQALVDGLYPGCGDVGYFSSQAVADTLFSPTFPQDTTALIAAVLANMGGSFAPLQSAVAPLLAEMNTVLGCCSTALCQSQVKAASCSFADLPWALTASGGTVSFSGALATGSSIAEVFELEYANGFTGTDVAFGRLSTEAQVRHLMGLYTTKYRRFDRTPALARANGSNIARQILNAVEEPTGAPVGDGPPDARLTVYVGHDSTLSAVGGLLGLDWHPAGFRTDDMPPGGALGFELLESRRFGRYYVRPVFLTQTLGQMHDGAALDGANLPDYQGLRLPGCEFEGGRLCSLATFVSLVQGRIDPASAAPATYQ